jgi:predicted small secreted protein
MAQMVRKFLIVTSVVLGVSLLTLACKNSGGGTGPDGGPNVKLICKMNNQCWICPNDNAMKKCIINPVSSGCKQASAGECQ